jgi:uncharacterized protein YkwD
MRGRTLVRMDTLESRRLMSAASPTATEQFVIERLNQARANPTAEAARYGITLNEGLPSSTISTAPKQPLAPNAYLTDSARKHSQWMLATDTFSHTGVNRSDPNDRMAASGYTFAGTWKWGENIAWQGTTGTLDLKGSVDLMIRNFFVDAGIPDRGHRVNMMDGAFKEVGGGIATGTMKQYHAAALTEDFAASGSGSFLTGVAYTDAIKRDHFYTVGEGLGGITVTAKRLSDGATFKTTTWSAGGYSMKLSAGTYAVTASGNALNGTVSSGNVTIGSQNVKRDFLPIAATASVSGNVFNDLNANRRKDAGEGYLASWKIFDDANRNGVLDANEKTAITDRYGNYKLTGLTAGSHRIRIVTPSNWRRTSPAWGYPELTLTAGQSFTGYNFGELRIA